jgi:hypothetical protein
MRGTYFFFCRFWRSDRCARKNVSRGMLFLMLLLVLSHVTPQRLKTVKVISGLLRSGSTQD